MIRAMGLTEAEALGSVRLTLGRGTSPDDVKIAAKTLIRAFKTTKKNVGARTTSRFFFYSEEPDNR